MQQKLVNDIIQWDVKSWGRAIDFWEKNVEWTNVDQCLELGAREGGLSLWLALKGKKVVCSDIDNTNATAGKLHEQYNLNSAIQYANIDAREIPYENYFDIIIFKSILGGIGRNADIKTEEKVLNEMYKALKPGGRLLFAENLQASRFHRFMRQKANKWGNYWHYLSITEVKNLLKVFPKSSIHTSGVIGTFGRNEKQRGFLAQIDNAILNRVCPGRWKYIVYGIAEK